MVLHHWLTEFFRSCLCDDRRAKFYSMGTCNAGEVTQEVWLSHKVSPYSRTSFLGAQHMVCMRQIFIGSLPLLRTGAPGSSSTLLSCLFHRMHFCLCRYDLDRRCSWAVFGKAGVVLPAISDGVEAFVDFGSSRGNSLMTVPKCL